MMIQRTLGTYKATAIELGYENGQAVANELGSVEYMSTRENKAEARAKLKAAGVPVKQGMKIVIELVEETLYRCSLEDFMTVAVKVEK